MGLDQSAGKWMQMEWSHLKDDKGNLTKLSSGTFLPKKLMV